MRALLRPVAAVAAGLITVTMLQAPAGAARPAGSASDWLEKQLDEQHLVHNDEFDFDDYGLTADVAIALDAIGGHRRTVRRIGGAVAGAVDAYTAPDAGEVYAGATAKAAVLASVSGRDPRAFGGADLVERLEGQTADSGVTAGRIADTSEFGDYANTIGQAFATLALARAGSDESGAARRFLLAQQCADGWFRISFSGPEAADQSCDGAGDAKPNVDVTALAVVMLEALPSRGRAVNRSVRDALGWLKEVQRRNGSFEPGDSELEGPNANSTGLAAWALGEAGRCRPAKKAAAWVQQVQVRGKTRGTSFARRDKGAVAYDRAAYAAGKAGGITGPDLDQWRRATAQAAPGLRFLQGC